MTTIDDLERMYEALARGIDRAGPEHEAVFLAKLVLMLANDLGEVQRFEQCVDACAVDASAAPRLSSSAPRTGSCE